MRLVPVFSILFFLIQNAVAGSIGVSIQSPGNAANDLLYRGELLDRDEAIDLAKKSRVDLSQLDPQTNDAWTQAPLPIDASARADLPSEGASLEYDSALSSVNNLFRVRVRDSEGRQFRLTATLEAHAAIIRSALLRRLGYPVAFPKFYRSLTIRFVDAAARDRFLDQLSDRTLTARERWVRQATEGSNTVELQGMVLENARIDVPPYHWGVIPENHLRDRRALRALLTPLTLVDIPERINLYSWDYSKIMSQALLYTHPYAERFTETAFDDQKWIARKIGLMSRDELARIVAAGEFPSDVSALVLERLLARRNQMVKLLSVARELPSAQREIKVNTRITIGAVKNGKLTQARYDGFALEFTYPDPESPLRRDEVARFAFIEGISAGLSRLTVEMNTKLLDIQGVGDLAERQSKALQDKLIKHMIENPGTPFQEKVDVWGGPIGGFGVNLSRHVVTGSYYGSDAAIQLVDNFSVQGRIGYFMGISGIQNVMPSVAANLALQRNYLHVRPVADMKEATKTDWKWLFVPTFFNRLTRVLDKGPETANDERSTDFIESRSITEEELLEEDTASEAQLRAFLDELKEGEIFSVTDSVLAGAKASVSIPVAALLGLGPLGFGNSLVIGAGVDGMVMRRTTFVRTADGIQVYLQRAREGQFQATVDFNWWMNIFKFEHARKIADAHTKAFLLDRLDTTPENAKKTVAALKPLLRGNNAEVLESNFFPIELNHELTAVVNRAKFLRYRWMNIEESHSVRVRPAADAEGTFDPDDHIRSLYSHSITKATGTNDYSFLSDIIDAWAPGWGYARDNAGSNPANSFMGTSKWALWTTEAETTPGREQAPITRIEHHWQGWLLSLEQFNKIISGIEARVVDMDLPRPLVNRDLFNGMKQLQLYHIQTQLVIYQKGMERIENAMFGGKLEQIYPQLVEIAGGQQAVNAWCKSKGNLFVDYNEREDGRWVKFKCVTSWMRDVLQARKNRPEAKEERIKWMTRLLGKLERKLDLKALMKWLGRDGHYFQVQIGGFRKGDENDDMSYVSDSIGMADRDQSISIFQDFAEKYHILQHEVEAGYLSEGF